MIVNFALNYLGTKEGTATHKKIVDGYNKIDPLPEGYKLKISDSWCAAFVSYCFNEKNNKKFPYECSCPRMIKKAQAAGLWIEDDGYIPKRNDCVLYDWQDNGAGDNKGVADHIGIVESVTKSGIITVIEGNYSDSVKRRQISVNGKYIRGFIKSSSIVKPAVATKPKKETTKTKSVSLQVVKDVIAGKYGNGATRKKKLTELGYDYETIQKEVNKFLGK